MAAYIVATVRITDREKFGAYVRATAGLSESFGGQPVVLGKVAEVFEGDVDPEERVIVTRFPDAEAARAYVRSERYQAGKTLRIGAGSVEARLLIDPA